jgi:endonuclease/exonuclease/phosphatase (EEP) superfamily protein YafD
MHVLGGYEVAVVTRGKVGYNPSIGMETQKPPWLVRELPCIIALDGRIIHAVCVHLNGAVTDVGLHRASTWNSHYLNRMSRLREMLTVRNLLTLQQLTPAPTIIGGDFNAPAGDAVFRVLEPDLTDAFATVGAGWGDTFPNKTPLLRIDHIYANDQLTPVRARTVETVNSDHRMVVVDYAYK